MKNNKAIKREIIGKLVSITAKESVIVELSREWRHPVYKKAVRRKIRIPAHVEGLSLTIGQNVRLISSKPISKTKHYKVIGVV